MEVPRASIGTAVPTASPRSDTRILRRPHPFRARAQGSDVIICLVPYVLLEGAVRPLVEGEAAHLVDRRGHRLPGPRLDLGRSRLRRDKLAEQGAVGELDLDREARRLEGEGADRRRL